MPGYQAIAGHPRGLAARHRAGAAALTADARRRAAELIAAAEQQARDLQ